MAQQELVKRDDIVAAQRLIEAEAKAGRLSAEEAARRSEAVIHCVTPHDLYRASGGLAGSAGSPRRPRRSVGKPYASPLPSSCSPWS
ncbi:MAG: hypothetical protein ACRD0A_00580 [Acidimicrobiales bacterium]